MYNFPSIFQNGQYYPYNGQQFEQNSSAWGEAQFFIGNQTALQQADPQVKEASSFKRATNNSTRNLYFTQNPQFMSHRSNSHEQESIPFDQEEFEYNSFKIFLRLKNALYKKITIVNNVSSTIMTMIGEEILLNLIISKCDFCQYGKNCPQGDNCIFSHNKVEQLYHPNRYKTKYCQSRVRCIYGKFCSFAHSDNEIIIPQKLHKMNQNAIFWMYSYKTVWCPFIEDHDRSSCVYAHNAQDFRRDPNIIKYEPFDCPNWNKSNNVTCYEQGGCQQMEQCKLCHGWKEQEYHPSNYKTKRCSNGILCKKRDKDCAYYHKDGKDKDSDRRLKNQQPPNSKQQFNNTQPLDNYTDIASSKKMPRKVYSNFQGPITPTTQYNESKQLNKLQIGQPFEVFSIQSQTSNIATTDSRKISESSQEQFQKVEQSLQPKKNRSAPTTPEENEIVQQQFNIEGISISLKQPSYSKHLMNIFKIHNGIEIANLLKQAYVTENKLIDYKQKDLDALGVLTYQQKRIITDVLCEFKMDNELIEGSMKQANNGSEDIIQHF